MREYFSNEQTIFFRGVFFEFDKFSFFLQQHLYI